MPQVTTSSPPRIRTFSARHPFPRLQTMVQVQSPRGYTGRLRRATSPHQTPDFRHVHHRNHAVGPAPGPVDVRTPTTDDHHYLKEMS